MIVDLLISAFYVIVYALSAVLRYLPDVVASSSIVSAFVTANSYLSPISNILDTLTIVLVVGFSVTFELSYFGYKGFNWIIRKIPGVS